MALVKSAEEKTDREVWQDALHALVSGASIANEKHRRS